MNSPYDNSPKEKFWKTGVAQTSPLSVKNLYKRKFDITLETKIAAAGSCFAQHITRFLKVYGFNVMDYEPPPVGVIGQEKKFGYSLFSGRYGNIYTARQLLQLTQEAFGIIEPTDIVWEKDGRYYDALRPAVEPNGLPSIEEVHMQRK